MSMPSIYSAKNKTDSHSEFFYLDVFDQFVYVIRANQQRHVIKAIPLKQSSYLTVQVNS